jgi:hypothetical protein
MIDGSRHRNLAGYFDAIPIKHHVHAAHTTQDRLLNRRPVSLIFAPPFHQLLKILMLSATGSCA